MLGAPPGPLAYSNLLQSRWSGREMSLRSSTSTGRENVVVSYVELRSLVRQEPLASLALLVTFAVFMARAVIGGRPPDWARVAVTAPIHGVVTASATTVPPSRSYVCVCRTKPERTSSSLIEPPWASATVTLRLAPLASDAAAVFVLGHRGDLVGHRILLGDRLDDDLVEPVVDRVGVGLAGQVPLDRHAGHGVTVLGGRHPALQTGALGPPVDDVDLAAGLGGDRLDARTVVRLGRSLGAVGTLDHSVDAVGDLQRLEGDRRQREFLLAIARRALDRLKPEGR
jgi:hypothetical protein